MPVVNRKTAEELAEQAREIYIAVEGRTPHPGDPILLEYAVMLHAGQLAAERIAEASASSARELPGQIARTVSAKALQPIQAALTETARGPIQSIKNEARITFWVGMFCALLCAMVFLAFTYRYTPDELRQAAVLTAEKSAQSAQGRAIAELTLSLDALRTEAKKLRAERDQLWQFVDRFVERSELLCSEDAEPEVLRVCEAYRELRRNKER